MGGPRRVDGLDGNFDLGEGIVTLWCTGAVTAENLVAIDVSDTTDGIGNSVQQADENGAGDIDVESIGMPVGIAMETLTAAGHLRVQVKGIRTAVPVDAATAVGDQMVTSSTAGSLQRKLAVAADTRDSYTVVAVALTAVVGGTATLKLLDPMHFLAA